MAKSANEPSPPPRQIVRLPSFRASAIVAAALWLAFVAWILVDAWFPMTLALVASDLGLGPFGTIPVLRDKMPTLLPRNIPIIRDWAALGGRIVALEILASAATLTMTLAALRLFVGGPGGGRGVRGWSVFVLLVAAWLGLPASFDPLWWSGVQVRARWRLPRYEGAVVTLRRDWPKKAGTLPGFGVFYTIGRGEAIGFDKLGQSFSLPGGPARAITRKGRGLDFALAIEPNCMVEYLPDEVSVGRPFSARKIISRVHLRGDWYLTRHAPP